MGDAANVIRGDNVETDGYVLSWVPHNRPQPVANLWHSFRSLKMGNVQCFANHTADFGFFGGTKHSVADYQSLIFVRLKLFHGACRFHVRNIEILAPKLTFILLTTWTREIRTQQVDSDHLKALMLGVTACSNHPRKPQGPQRYSRQHLEFG